MMAGATQRHNVVITNIVVALAPSAKTKGCRTTSSDTAVRTGQYGVRYPDVVVDCGPPDPSAKEAARPTVVVEVSSPGTSAIDLTDKIDEYRAHEDIQVIVLVDPDVISVKVYRRDVHSLWTVEKYDELKQWVDLPEINSSIRLRDIYDTLELEARLRLHMVQEPESRNPGVPAAGVRAVPVIEGSELGPLVSLEEGEALKAELAEAFATPEASYQPLTADEVIRRNSQQASSDSQAMPATIVRGSGLGPLVSLEEGEALLDEITVDDDSTDWAASELLSAPRLAERLQIPLAALDAWRTANKAIAFRNDAGEYIYPVRQFDGTEPVEGLDRVAAFFSSPDEAWEWLVTPCRYTNDEAPIDRLRSKHVDEVVRAAEGMNDFQ
jgi:Uma2 family endonuclease